MTEKNDQKTDSMTEEEEESLLESEEQENQLDAKHRTPALASLIAGYTMALGFGVLLAIVLSSGTTSEEDGELVTDDEVVEEGEIVSGLDVLPQESDVISLSGGSSIAWPIGKEWVDPGYTAKIEDQDFTPFVETVSFVDHTQPGTYKVVYTVRDPNSEEVHSSERFVTVNAGGFIHNANPVAYNDRLDGVIVDDDPIRAVVGDADRDVLYLDNDDRHLRHAGLDIGDGRVEGGVGGGGNGGRGGHEAVVAEFVMTTTTSFRSTLAYATWTRTWWSSKMAMTIWSLAWIARISDWREVAMIVLTLGTSFPTTAGATMTMNWVMSATLEKTETDLEKGLFLAWGRGPRYMLTTSHPKEWEQGSVVPPSEPPLDSQVLELESGKPSWKAKPFLLLVA